MREALRIQLLGPVRLLAGDDPVPIGGPAVRGLLALLALDADRIVGLDDLIDALWGHDPPATARTIVHGNVSLLRRVMRSFKPSNQALIETVAPGYRLIIDPDRIDLYLARRLFAQADAAPLPERADLLRQAYRLWQGHELSDVPASIRAPDLAELRTAVHSARVDADLALGRHAELIVELSTMVRENPRSERAVGQLMRALYYSGRRAEALEAYRRVARHVSDTLGIDLGPDLRELQERILNDDLPPMSGAEPVKTVDVTRVVPQQLPPAAGLLAGRDAELAWLNGLPDGAVGVVTGAAGVGKTSLTVWWAHRVAPRFPDGVLFAPLSGPADVLTQFLLGLGVPAADLPEQVSERVALYRSLIAGRRMLVLLDDAASAEQVRQLLPPGNGSLALVTSRSRLDGLVVSNAARVRRLDPLARADSVRLIGELAGAEAAEYHERLAGLCGDLPLALRIVGARLAAGPQWTVEEFVTRLESERTRLAALDVDDAGVRAALDVSYRGLPAEVARTFRALGALSPETSGPHLVAALEDIGLAEARRRLRVLAAHHLLIEQGPDVFTQHDLVRLYQREIADAREQVLARSLRYYQAVGDRARRRLLRIVDPVQFHDAPVEGPELDGYDDALAWFAAEWPNLLAICEAAQAAGHHEDVWRLARVAHTYRVVRPLWNEWARLIRIGMASAQACEDEQARYWMLISRCAFALTFEVGDGGLADAEGALEIARRLGESRQMISAEIHRGCALTMCGRLDEAIECLRAVITETERTGEEELLGQALNNCAEAEKRAGKYVEAVEHQLASLAIDQRLGDDSYAVVSLNNLAELHLRLEDLDAAERYSRTAIGVAENRGFLLQEAVSRTTLSRILRRHDDVVGARLQLGLSLELRKRVSPRLTAAVAEELAALGP
ncbi:AfsR/SARP family transcriptional regulator [Amycolatopsis sp.]|uniref:AfsR/SARP family transcriptional regulator n=1 Tax=Amycolatopsis sp. TaxID=37632 RepID=UPI002BCB1066|nr:BTAD domain-containing putative transcriptional regulator [Amycolatopsis sp.]HVV09996.1 BTAD domain-containing putative transcriptional regulator [Amycolatopsis sp.]